MHKTHTGLSDAQAEIEYLKVSDWTSVALPKKKIITHFCWQTLSSVVRGCTQPNAR